MASQSGKQLRSSIKLMKAINVSSSIDELAACESEITDHYSRHDNLKNALLAAIDKRLNELAVPKPYGG